MPPVTLEPGSFRDKSSRVFYEGTHVYRALNREAVADWNRLQETSFYAAFSREGKIVPTRPVSLNVLPETDRGTWEAVLEHEPIPFVSYPYEWSFGMLQDAALLQLELLSSALREDMILKDASSFNIQWNGARPVFIDVPSFTAWTPGQPWGGYRQFCELFLIPLLLQAYRDVPFQPWLRGSLDGISPAVGSRLLGGDFYRPGVLLDVLLHARFERRYARTTRHVKKDLSKAGFSREMILANVSRLTKIISRLSWKTSRSHWTDYPDTHSYGPQEEADKRNLIEQVLRRKRRRLVWDLGCNMGDFSRLASKHADYVVAMDSDAQVIEALYRQLKKEKEGRVLPLVADVADLSSGLGWQGKERKALVDRGRPDLILCLALVHHVAVHSNIPLREWVEWLARQGADLVIEFVTPEDPMVEQLLRNKDGNHDDYTQANFEAVLSRCFVIHERHPLGSGRRILYTCQAKPNV